MGLVAILFLSVILLCTSFNGSNSMKPPNPQCPSFDCGNGITISYPFWHQTKTYEHFCGYPGFKISCIDQNPILHLSNKNNPYPIKQIDYSDKSLTLSYALPKNSTCPKLNDYTFNYSKTVLSLLNYNASANQMVYFFYNCSFYPPSVAHIRCLTYGSKRSFVFKEKAVPEFDWQSYCESSVVVPVNIDEAAGIRDLVEDFGQALRDGFKLSWMNTDKVCQSCEDSGGFCGYSNGRSSCICGDRRHPINCHDTESDFTSHRKGAVSIEGELNYAAIGAMFFAGLIIMGSVFYFVQNTRFVSSYKPV